ncbi:MAG: Uma2 family endonuclease [Burkholderiales bacterium]|nr:Uma2 family endonuclease [Burkholderiales bacterium]
MGIPQKAPAWIAPDEYLALEERASVKHEYLDGVIYAWQGYGPAAMAGGSRRHNEIVQNLVVALRPGLRGGPCRAYATDMRLHVKAKDAYFYPDLMITCAPGDLDGDGTRVAALSEPLVIMEVLSESTEAFDRGEKFDAYKLIPTLREYVLVPASGRCIEVYRRQADGAWTRQDYAGVPVDIRSVNCTLAPDAVFEDVS